MTKYRKHNWPELFDAFEKSGLTQTEFCKQHDINPKYFGLKLSKNKASKNTAFAKVEIEPKQAVTAGLTLEVGLCKVHCPMDMPIPSFVTLVKSLE